MKKLVFTLLTLTLCSQYGLAELTEGNWSGTMLFGAKNETLNTFAIRTTGTPDVYEIDGLFDGWFTAGPVSDEPAVINTISAEYDSELGTFSILPGQTLFDYDNDGTMLHVSLISASINYKGGFDLHPDRPVVFVNENGVLKLDSMSAFYLGQMTENNDYAMGFGYAWNVSLSPVNGTMSYESYETTGWVKSVSNSLLTFNADNTLSIDNICGLGFGRPITFTMKPDGVIEADNVVYGTLVAGTEEIVVYPCSCDKYGDPDMVDGKCLLRGTISETDENHYSVVFGLWGIFDEAGKPFYHFRNTESSFDATNPFNNSVETLTVSSSDDDVFEWYTIDGVRIDPTNATHGIYIVKSKDRTIKIYK